MSVSVAYGYTLYRESVDAIFPDASFPGIAQHGGKCHVPKVCECHAALPPGKDWEQLGFALSRATMANWIIRCSQDYLYPVIGYLREQLLKRTILHCDETPVQVLKEEGRKPQSKSEHVVVLFRG